METEKLDYCKRIIFTPAELPEGARPINLLAIIILDGPEFLEFRTANGQYRLSKKKIISISDTHILFKANEVRP